MIQINRIAPAKLKIAAHRIRQRADKLKAVDIFGRVNNEKLKKLSREYEIQISKSQGEFTGWYWGLDRQSRTRVIHLYETKGLSDESKEMLKGVFTEQIKQHPRTFVPLYTALYRTGDSETLYGLVKQCFKLHFDRITRRMSDVEKSSWGLFLESVPRNYIVKSLSQELVSFGELAARIRLNEGSRFFYTLAISYFKEGKEQALERDMAVFERLYDRNLSNNVRAQLIELFIRHSKLNQFPDLVEKIYFDFQHYIAKPQMWESIGQAEKEKFHRHIIKRRLKEFFGNLNQNHERFIYWKKFFHKIDDVILPDTNQTILMYFRDLVILEILGTGAIYIYTREDFQQYFKKHVDYAMKTKRESKDDFELSNLSRTRLMNKDLVHYANYRDGWFSHHSGWQLKVDAYLKDCGWEVRTNVLEEEARKLKFLDDSDE